MRLQRKISLILLFSINLILIGITGARIPLVVQRRGLQQFRTVFASSEILAATCVSNAIVLGSFLRDRGVKKSKYRGGSTSDSIDRRSSTRRHTLEQWGSDEDLARSLGYRTKPELAEKRNSAPRRAPVANLDLLSVHGAATPFPDANWQFPKREARASHSSGDSEIQNSILEESLPSPRSGRRVSFYDVGRLLENSIHSSTPPSLDDSVSAQDFALYPRRGSRASTSLYSNSRSHHISPRRSSRLSQQSQEYDVYPRSSQQDAGAFLSGSDVFTEEDESPSSTSPNSVAQDTVRSIQPPQLPPQPHDITIDSLPLADVGNLLSSQPQPSA